jgi:plasmid stability protein
VKTLYIRNVPDDVTERLERLAAREGMSVSAFAVRELRLAARRADNPDLLADLPSFEVSADEIVADIGEGRDAR